MTATGLTALLLDLLSGRVTGTAPEIAARYGVSLGHVRGYMRLMGRG